MTSGISSKWVMFKGALKRFKWLSILFGVVLFLEMPLLIWMELSRQLTFQGGNLAQVVNNGQLPRMIFNPMQHFTNMAVSIIFGLILFYYLQNDRASTFFHSLPVKRWFLYTQNLLAGLILIWVPIIINGLLAYGVFNFLGITETPWHLQVYNPAMDLINNNVPKLVPIWQVALSWLILSLLMTALFFIFTAFVGMFTGNVLLQGALTIIGLILPLGLYVLVKYNLGKLLYGYSGDFNGTDIERLSPLVSYLDDSLNRFQFKEITWYVWYFIITLVVCGLSIYLYRKRPAEAAGETLAAEWIRRLFKYGVTACLALTGGIYFGIVNEESLGLVYLGYLVGGVFGYVVADMVAYKSFHFYKRWKGMIAFAAIFILIMASINLDLYGFEKYVPEQDEVKEVFLSNLSLDGSMNGGGLTGKENIKRAREFHQQLIKMEAQNKADVIAQRSRQNNIVSKRPTESTSMPVEPERMVRQINITYTLDNGSKVKRAYNIDVYRYREFLKPIFNSQEAKKIMHYRLFNMDPDKMDQINVNNHLGKSIRIYKRDEMNQATEALRKDVLNASYEALVEGKIPSRANIEFFSTVDKDQKVVIYNLEYFADFKDFEGFLKEHGYLEDLFINPEDVSRITVRRAGSDKTTDIMKKENIKVLLDWCTLDDGKSFLTKQNEVEYGDYAVYYGKIEKKGNTQYIMFNIPPYSQQTIYDILKQG